MSRVSPLRDVRSSLVAALCLAVGAVGLLGVAAAPAHAAVGDDVIGWVEVEDGAISGGPGLNSGDHGNFSGSGSYTFRETGMQSVMTVTAPAAGVYPVYIRYAAGPLGADENVTRSMGLLTNGGARQVVSYPMTSLENWEAWRFATAQVTLQQGTNTLAVQCDRATDFCRLNFDAIQVGGTAPDPCAATPVTPGYTSLFDGTFASFDGWRKAAVGGFGRQSDCTIRSYRGRGATWNTTQQATPYTLELDWRRIGSNDDSSVHLASSSRAGADPVGGYSIPIGADTGAIVPAGGTLQPADPTALAAALRPIGQWNTYRIEVTDTRLEVFLNGTRVNAMNRAVAASGFIGLENRSLSDRVHFQRIQVRPDVEVGALAAPFTRATLADGTTNPGGESTLGNLVAEAQRWATRTPELGGAQLAFVAPDALGADLDQATVTYRQAGLVQPSGDPLVNLRLTGEQVRTVLEQQWQRTASGDVPARPFLRLGTSTGFTYTYDPTRPEGSRVTGTWLDGVALVPTTTYSVTVSSSLAAGGDNFRAFLGGTGRQTTTVDGQDALVGYLGALADPATGGTPLAPDLTQHSVGVAFPGGAPASYVVGGPIAVDLTSLVHSAPSDQADTAVLVSLGGRSLGSFPVDATRGTTPYDEYGAAAVRATVPADTPAGPTTLSIVGDRTGTTVTLPVTVRAIATSTTSVAVSPAAVPVVRGVASVAVTVASTDGTPNGDVAVYVDGALRSTVALVDGRVTVPVGPFATVGNRSVEARYLGDATTSPSTSRSATVRVVKAAARLAVKVQPAKIVAGRTQATLAITATAAGLTPSGTVTVKIGAKTYSGTLRNGAVKIKLARFAKPGPVKAVVAYAGDARTAAASTTVKLTVKKGRV